MELTYRAKGINTLKKVKICKAHTNVAWCGAYYSSNQEV